VKLKPPAWIENRLSQFFGEHGQSRLGYDAVKFDNKRRPATGRLLWEERELMENQRRLLVSDTRDLQRNFTIAAWAIRKHLDFVASFNFNCRTPDKGLNVEIEALVEEWSRKENFDACARHDRQRFIRLLEARRYVDGDIGVLKIIDGTVQAIEGDRIRNPFGAMDLVPDPGLLGVNLKGLIEGAILDDRGRTTGYVVNKRTLYGGFIPERVVSSADLLLHGCFDRFDQVRGVSPIAAGLNQFKDVYENFDFALAKMKIAQLFGMVLTRDSDDAPAPTYPEFTDPSVTDDSSQNPAKTAAETNKARYEINFGRGPVILDMDPGDDAKFLENKTPSTEFKEFTQTIIQVALKALDIPFSFYDEAYTNFFGSRSALMLYLKSAEFKQHEVREVLRHLTVWKLILWIASGRLILPRGMSVADIKFHWIPSGVPWWNPQQEITAELSAIAGTLQDFDEIRREHFGDSWYDVIDRQAEQRAYAKSKGVPISLPTTLAPQAADDAALHEVPGAAA
jgi:capsid protein